MNPLRIGGLLLLPLLAATPAPAGKEAAKKDPREALQAFNDLIGTWKGTGQPNGTREEQQKGFWQEKISWRWQFKGEDAWLVARFTDSKRFARGELRYLPDRKVYQFTAQTPAKDKLVFEGKLEKKRLTLDRTDEKTKETQRLVVSLLHSNRYLYRYEVKPGDHALFTMVYQVGATKQGVPFASADDSPECVVSGGLGTIEVRYKDKTYYVCCTGCQEAFKDSPEKYIKEYEARQAKKKAGRQEP